MDAKRWRAVEMFAEEQAKVKQLKFRLMIVAAVGVTGWIVALLR